jgi:hypothetical protein
MPRNGETNTTFGVYRSLCCETEIVIAEGATFPDCPQHITFTTQWKLVSETDRGPEDSPFDPQRKPEIDAA